LRLNREFFTPNREFTGNASRRVGERRPRRPLHTGLLPKIVLHPCDRALEIAGRSRGQCCAYPMIVARSASCVGRPNSANSKPTDQRQTETARRPDRTKPKCLPMPFNFWIARQADRRRVMRNDAFALKADCRDSSILLVALAWLIAGQRPACKSIIDESCPVRWCTERGSFFVCERRTGLSIKAGS
jgi:hypothetical protein